MLDVLHAPRFIDLAPAQVYATLLDEGIYHCSERTMYRVLAAQQEVRDRRAQRRHPHYTAPELLATAPNQLWSWDITKLKGPTTLVVVPLVRHPRRVQPLCGGLDGRAARIGGPRGALDHGQLRAAGGSPRPAHAPRRSRLVDALETGGLSRASVYYTPRAVADADLALMRRLDALHLECPFAGSRMLRDLLRGEDQVIGRDHARTLMRRMGITAIYRRPRTSARHPAHPVFPYLLRHRVIDRPNQVWATDITYIPMARGFVFLCAIMDWATRKVLAWRVSATLTSDCCVAALEEALDRFGAPEIFNTDQGAQFTSAAFLDVLRAHQIQISMDGTGCWRDNVVVERPLALGQVRGRLSPRLRDDRGRARRIAALLHLFQSAQAPHSACGPDTGCRLQHSTADSVGSAPSGRVPKNAA